MNYTYQIITPRDIVLGISRLDIEYSINNNNENNNASNGAIGCSTNYILTISTDPSQPNRTTYMFRTCIITNGQIVCSDNNISTTNINSVILNFISSIGNTIVSIRIDDNFGIAQNYCLVITFIVIDNAITQDVEDIIISNYDPEGIIDYVSRPTKLGSHDRNRLIRNYHERLVTNPVRYTNSISDVVSNCNFVPYLAVQDRYFVINYDNDVNSEYATVKLDKVKISGWTDRDIYFFEKVYADVSDSSVQLNRIMGLLEPLVHVSDFTPTPFTVVHNMYPLSIHRNGEIMVYNNQPKDFPYVTSLFHTANVSQVRYGDNIYKPLTPYMYYRTITQIGQPTKVELLYTYLNRNYVVIDRVQSEKVLRTFRAGMLTFIDLDSVTRNILLPVDYNMLFYLESKLGDMSFVSTDDFSDYFRRDHDNKIFVTNQFGEAIEYPVIWYRDSAWNCNLVLFQRDNPVAINFIKDRDLDVRIILLEEPMSFFAGGGLLGWGRHKPGADSKYYLFSWYKIMHTKRLASVNTNSTRPDDYLRYYYYYQYII